MKNQINNDLLQALKLAEYKIGEMLNHGCFEEEHEENFRRSQKKIKEQIEKAEKNG